MHVRIDNIIGTLCSKLRSLWCWFVWSALRAFVILLLLLLLFTAIELSLGGSSPYSSTDKTNKNKCT